MTDQEPGAQLTESYEPQSYAPQENTRPEIATVAFGGYRTEDVDRLVDQYEERTAGYRRSLARQIAIADNLRNLNTRLTAQLEAACRERDELRHRAESPFEAAGKAAQDLVDNARNTARDTIAEARAQAEKQEALERAQRESRTRTWLAIGLSILGMLGSLGVGLILRAAGG